MVVLPEDSGPKISLIRPRGKPPTPSAASSEIEPVEITETGTMASFDPRRRIEPLPNCFSIWPRALSKARERSLSSIGGMILLGERELKAYCSSRYNKCRSLSDALKNYCRHPCNFARLWRCQQEDHRH